MNVLLVTPAPPGSRKGNRVTALRWARLFRELGHRVRISQEYTGQRCHVLVALHALKSAPSIQRFRAERTTSPLVVALTGTDLYGDIHTSPEAVRSLKLADRLVVLQPLGMEELPEPLRPRARAIFQSIAVPPFQVRPRPNSFEVCVMGHLRPVKDPFRTASAARLLPASSRVRVLHLGGALSEELQRQAEEETQTNPRYRWVGELPRKKALRMLARCRLLVLTSVSEGGANVISESVAVGVPVLSSHIAGSVGFLGPDYPGYFPVGDTQALAELLLRAERETSFYQELKERCEALRPLIEPARERQAWADLLVELG